MDFKPVLDNIVLKVKKEKEVKQGSVIIPGKSESKISRGEVVAVGGGIITEEGKIPVEVQVGDIVLYDKTFETEVEVVGDDRFVVVKEKEILTRIIEK